MVDGGALLGLRRGLSVGASLTIRVSHGEARQASRHQDISVEGSGSGSSGSIGPVCLYTTYTSYLPPP
jgi:hypothetical protein